MRVIEIVDELIRFIYGFFNVVFWMKESFISFGFYGGKGRKLV